MMIFSMYLLRRLCNVWIRIQIIFRRLKKDHLMKI